MDAAVEQARLSFTEGGIPIGAVLVQSDQLLSAGRNRRLQDGAHIQHAEINCLGNLRCAPSEARGATIYSTHMPCYMCAGAIVQYEIVEVVSGDSSTLPHARSLLEWAGIRVIDRESREVKEMLQNFIEKHPDIWNGMPSRNVPNGLQLESRPAPGMVEPEGS